MAELRRLPAPREGDWDWQVGAACRGQETSDFYHPENERGPSRLRRELRAKAVCARCPVIANCLNWALEAREPYGVWGGMSVEEREDLLSRQRIEARQNGVSRRDRLSMESPLGADTMLVPPALTTGSERRLA
jgi:WhiB family redox-sensing transcriptional regulator